MKCLAHESMGESTVLHDVCLADSIVGCLQGAGLHLRNCIWNPEVSDPSPVHLLYACAEVAELTIAASCLQIMDVPCPLNFLGDVQGDRQAGIADVVESAGILGAGHASLCCACLRAGLEGGGTLDWSW